MPHLEELKTRMSLNYSVHMLDVILHHLKPRGDDSTPPPESTRAAAEFSMTLLRSLPSMCPSSMKPSTVQRLFHAVDGIAEWACTLLNVRLDTSAPIYIRELSELSDAELDTLSAVVAGLVAVCEWGHTDPVYRRLTSHPNVIGISVMLWVCTYHGHLPLYPFNQRRDIEPERDTCDSFTRIFFQTANKAPRELAAAVLEGRICSPERVVQVAIERVRVLPSLYKLPHLSHLPNGTMEHDNLRSTVLAMDQMMRCRSEMHDLMMQARAAEVFIIILSAFSSRLVRFKDSHPDTARKQDERLVDVLFLAEQVVEWAFVSSKFGFSASWGVICRGAVQLLGDCLDLGDAVGFIGETGDRSFEETMNMLVQFSTYPKNLTALHEEMLRCITGRLPDLSDGVPKESVEKAMERLSKFVPYLDRQKRPRLCDNMKAGFNLVLGLW